MLTSTFLKMRPYSQAGEILFLLFEPEDLLSDI